MKNEAILPLELRKLGLSEKEARVYLIVLKLGYSSVQNIAEKVKISRPTVYEIIKKLEKKELIVRSSEKNKKYFAAQSPDYLLGILKRQKKELEEKERELIRIIALLRSEYYLQNKGEIKKYQGKSGIDVLFDDFLSTHSKEILVLISDEKIWPIRQRNRDYQKIKRRLGKIQVKEFLPISNADNYDYIERKQINFKKMFKFKGVVIYDKVIVFTSLRDYLLIGNREIIDLVKIFFNIIWESY